MTVIEHDEDLNPYMQGNFRPVREEVTEFELEVLGEIPTELSGRYLRNGPNPFADVPTNHHWFLGAGMVCMEFGFLKVKRSGTGTDMWDPQNSVNFVTKMIFMATTGITVAVAPTQMLEVSRGKPGRWLKPVAAL